MQDCLFCKISSGEIQGRVVTETEDLIVLEDINPQAPTHLLVIPKRHIASLDDSHERDGELLGKLLLACQDAARERGLVEEGYRVVNNCGTGAGQTIPHLHFHLLGGRIFTWPPG